jgi:SOS-response transcriptional repressor LexA
MQDQTKQIRSDRDRVVQRALVAQTLREDHGPRWTRGELEAELGDADPPTIADALTRLQREGVVELDGEAVRASRATRHLDELALIAL